ncbi:hypothetical protein P4C99_21880 [Pontiellaceae bacterium B1224]|nr:hypothetical protein [Pontiellaceae bacterium B1224]
MKHLLTTLFLIGLCATQTYSSTVITNLVVYDPSTVVGLLCKPDTPFDEIDRSRPENVLFCKTIAENTSQLEKLYPVSVNNDTDIMKMIRSDEISVSFHSEWSQKKLIFSFYYCGTYGPPHWFCFIDTPDSKIRVPAFLELENKAWRQGVDIAKYPVRVAFFDLCKKHGMYDATKTIGQKGIDSFINDCRNIDDIITDGIETDPEHYESVQILR